jgi:hypothetical protein
MPTSPDDQQRIDLLRVELLQIRLEWNMHYALVDEGPKWSLDFLRPVTPAQYNRSTGLLEIIMHR